LLSTTISSTAAHSDTLATFTHAVAVAIAITAIFSAVLAANDRSDIVYQVMNFLFLIYHKTSSQKANSRSLSTVLTIMMREGASTLRFILRVVILEGNILCLIGPIFVLNDLCNLS
jgi:hypothetical protein